MAINKNHEFEELNGVKCAIVEKNVKPERVSFLKELLEYNRYTVIVIPSPAPKVVTAILPKEGEQVPDPSSRTPETFTVGVTDVSFNAINAIFGRLLHTKDGHIVTLAYWQQKEKTAHDEIPYFE
ncbi:MAG: hypothetical protein JWM28_2791 [Chitinophagaceae bacterium]|nr:hypothetical protein [Chitinophagaceae bacterium]